MTIPSTASSSSSNYYSSMYSTYAASAAQTASKATTAAATTAATGSGATNITLSDAAKAAAAADSTVKDFLAVIAETRAALTKLLENAKTTSPFDASGKALIDLSSLDRRSVFAIASNGEGKFTADEQKLAKAELQRRFDSAMAGPTGVLRVSGDFNALYKSAIDYYEAMSPEEKATDQWKAERAALQTGFTETQADKSKVRKDIPNDPLAAYLQRVTEGTAGQPRDFNDVAKDARAGLDAQIAAAKKAGSVLNLSGRSTSGTPVDFTNFDSRTLSAISLNQGDLFSDAEVRAANAEVRKRNGANILAGLQYSDQSGDITMLSQSIISQFSAMSAEEREAAGWSDKLYESAVANYKASSQLASLLSQLTGGAATSGTGSLASLLNAGSTGASASSGVSGVSGVMAYL